MIVLADVTETKQIQTLQRAVLEAVASGLPLSGVVTSSAAASSPSHPKCFRPHCSWLLQKMREVGRCIVFSSNVLDEVQALCDRFVILCSGSIAAEGTIAETCDQTNSSNRLVNIRERDGC